MFHQKKRIYLDYASAPPLCDEAFETMRKTERLVGNPGAIHAEALEARRALEDARARIAVLLAVKPREVFFSSGLTEANNIAILGSARALEGACRTLKGTHWIVSSIEHSSVLDCFAEVERLGGTVEYIDPDSRGIILPDTIERVLRPETVFVSVGWGNNEIGTIQPLAKIARSLRTYQEKNGTRITFHSDAGQAPLYLSSGAHSLGIDILTLGGNKLYGPHGVGALYVDNNTQLHRIMHGGPQERGLRPGTENVALAAGFAAAFEKIVRDRDGEAQRLREMRDNFAHEITTHIPTAVINGDLQHALPHMLNISLRLLASSFQNIEYVCLALDHAGIAVSTKSACREGEESRSHVVEALGKEQWRAQNTLRFSLGSRTNEKDLHRVMNELTKILAKHN